MGDIVDFIKYKREKISTNLSCRIEDNRLDRIRISLEKINRLMGELRDQAKGLEADD